ncbi:MAG: hypothetical protein HY320_01955 [Armatimonadetes bacterium]|nr:hypothetical protein [Armatimonadota bacterium]
MADFEEASLKPYTRKHLTPPQVATLYQQALQQLEATVVNAWLNYVLNPHDESARAAYEQAAARLKTLEEDRERCLPSE